MEKEQSLIEMLPENLDLSKSIETGGFEIARPGMIGNVRENLQKSLDTDGMFFIGDALDSLINPARTKDHNEDNFGGKNNKNTHGEEFHTDAEEVPSEIEVVRRSVEEPSREELLLKALSDISEEEIEKASGAGSRGGKVIGTTSSGKPIYAKGNHKEHKNFDHKDHHEAYAAHYRMGETARQNRDDKASSHHSEQQAHHKEKWQAHEALGAKIPDFSDSCSKVKLATDSKKSEIDEVYDLIKSKSLRIPGLPAKPGGKAPKAPKDPLQIKQERDLKEELGVAKAEENDSIIDMVPEKPVRGLAKLHENSNAVREKKKKPPFVKAQGPGGVFLDFGKATGNPHADSATALLNQFADPVQEGNAQYQQDAYNQALTDYVTKGEAEYSKNATPFSNIKGGDQLDKSNDQQVKEEFEKGTLYQNDDAPAVKNTFNKTEMTLGNQVIKATSETDAALIEMMSKGNDMSDEGGVIADATSGGAVSITAGE